jgi:hypothetical protein
MMEGEIELFQIIVYSNRKEVDRYLFIHLATVG